MIRLPLASPVKHNIPIKPWPGAVVCRGEEVGETRAAGGARGQLGKPRLVDSGPRHGLSELNHGPGLHLQPQRDPEQPHPGQWLALHSLQIHQLILGRRKKQGKLNYKIYSRENWHVIGILSPFPLCNIISIFNVYVCYCQSTHNPPSEPHTYVGWAQRTHFDNSLADLIPPENNFTCSQPFSQPLSLSMRLTPHHLRPALHCLNQAS